MDLETAPVADGQSDEQATCDVHSCDGVYVLYDGDKCCRSCGHISGTGGTKTTIDRPLPNEWAAYERERQSDAYTGWKGRERVKFVGGFLAPWDFDRDL